MGPGTQAAETPSPAVVFETLMAHQRTAALRAAIELDLFRAVGQGPGDVASLARRCTASERGIRILCDFLTVIGLLTKHDGHYHHTPASSLFLDPRSPACIASTARFLGNPAMLEPYLHLSDIVRDGRTVLPGEGSVEPENPVWVEFAHSMAPMMAPMAAPLFNGDPHQFRIDGAVAVCRVKPEHAQAGGQAAQVDIEHESGFAQSVRADAQLGRDVERLKHGVHRDAIGIANKA